MSDKDFKATSEEFDKILKFIKDNKELILKSEPLFHETSDYDNYVAKTQQLRGIMDYHRELDIPCVTAPRLSFSFKIFVLLREESKYMPEEFPPLPEHSNPFPEE